MAQGEEMDVALDEVNGESYYIPVFHEFKTEGVDLDDVIGAAVKLHYSLYREWDFTEQGITVETRESHASARFIATAHLTKLVGVLSDEDAAG